MSRRPLTRRLIVAAALWAAAGTASALETTDELQARLLGNAPAIESAASSGAAPEQAAPEQAAPEQAAPEQAAETLGDVFAPDKSEGTNKATDSLAFDVLMSQPTAAERADEGSSRWSWLLGVLLLAAGLLVLHNKGKLGAIPGTARKNVRVLDRTQLGRDGSVTVLEVHNANGSVRRVLVGASNGSAPRLLLELGEEPLEQPLDAGPLDAGQVSEDRRETLAMLEEMVSARDSDPVPNRLAPVSDDEFHARLDDMLDETPTQTTTEEVASTEGQPFAEITRPAKAPGPAKRGTGRPSAVLPFERVLNAAMDEDPDPQPPRRRRGRWEVIA